MVIGIHGKIGSGKETVAIILADELDKKGYKVHHKLFAFKIKQFIELLTGEKMVTRFNDNKFVNGITDFTHDQKNKFFPQYGMTIGVMLQKIGTDLFRDQFHKDTWLEAMLIDYVIDYDVQELADDLGKAVGQMMVGVKVPMDEYREREKNRTKLPNWLIPDTRFPNEGDRIISEGGFIISVEGDPIKVNKESTRDKQHESETAMDNYEHKKYVIINDGTLDDLRNKIKEIVKKEFENGKK